MGAKRCFWVLILAQGTQAKKYMQLGVLLFEKGLI